MEAQINKAERRRNCLEHELSYEPIGENNYIPKVVVLATVSPGTDIKAWCQSHSGY